MATAWPQRWKKLGRLNRGRQQVSVQESMQVSMQGSMQGSQQGLNKLPPNKRPLPSPPVRGPPQDGPPQQPGKTVSIRSNRVKWIGRSRTRDRRDMFMGDSRLKNSEDRDCRKRWDLAGNRMGPTPPAERRQKGGYRYYRPE